MRMPPFARRSTSRHRRAGRSRAATSWRVESLEPRRLLASGDIYYVAVNGDNSHAGTSPGEAWATLQFAADQASPGETIRVLPGNYQGFDLRTSGTAAEPITFLANPGVVINQVNPVTSDGINLEQASYIVIDGFTLDSPNSSTRAGIRVVGDGFDEANAFSHHVTLRNNTVTGWGRWGILTGFSDDLLIENNRLSGSVDEHGLYVSNSGDRPVIRGNFIFNNKANGIHLNGDIETGDTSLPDVDGVIEGAIVTGNVVYGNGQGGGSGINGDGLVNARIENNLLYNNHASGISLYQIDGGAPSTGGVIVNNTIINASDARWVINLRNGATNTTIFNNILYNQNTTSTRGAITALEGSHVGLTSDYNLVDPRFSLNDGAAAINLDSWRSTTGNDQHSLPLSAAAVDELFRNMQANDYWLSETSAARDFGVTSLDGHAAPTTDHNGEPRPVGSAPDAGAYEFQIAGPKQSLAAVVNGQMVVARSDGTKFIRENWSTWPDANSQATYVGDFDDDGLDDVAGRINGVWHVARSTGNAFESDVWGQWSTAATWLDIQVADVDGNGKCDIVGRTNSGKWWVARSDGLQFVNELWGNWSSSKAWKDVHVADVDGDGRDDIVGRIRGKWWVAHSTGSALVNELWGSWSHDDAWTHVQVGDFDDDGLDDIAGRLNGRWWVAHSDGQRFTNERWGQWSPRVTWNDVQTADVNGDGRDDIIGRSQTGQWWVARSTGNGFVSELWGQWTSTTLWSAVQAADVDGDGRFDITGRAGTNWWVARSTGIGFVNEPWGTWPDSAVWTAVVPGYFA
jgi:hypothetical protein